MYIKGIFLSHSFCKYLSGIWRETTLSSPNFHTIKGSQIRKTSNSFTISLTCDRCGITRGYVRVYANNTIACTTWLLTSTKLCRMRTHISIESVLDFWHLLVVFVATRVEDFFFFWKMKASSSKTRGIQQLLDAFYKTWCIIPATNTTTHTLGFKALDING